MKRIQCQGWRWVVSDGRKERKMDPIHIRDVGKRRRRGESVMNPSFLNPGHKHELSLLPIKPRRRPHTHREGCHVYRLENERGRLRDGRGLTKPDPIPTSIEMSSLAWRSDHYPDDIWILCPSKKLSIGPRKKKVIRAADDRWYVDVSIASGVYLDVQNLHVSPSEMKRKQIRRRPLDRFGSGDSAPQKQKKKNKQTKKQWKVYSFSSVGYWVTVRTFISLSIFERMTTNGVPFLLPHHGLKSLLHSLSVNMHQPVMEMCNFGTFTAAEWAKINLLRPQKDLAQS